MEEEIYINEEGSGLNEGDVLSMGNFSDYMGTHVNHDFYINDLLFNVPPEQISTIEENKYRISDSMRSNNSDKIPVGIANEIFKIEFTATDKRSILNIDDREDDSSLNNTGKRGGIVDLIVQIKNFPFATIENAYLRTKLKIPVDHNMVFCVHNLTVSTSPTEPGAVLAEMVFTPMSYAPYSDFFHYKKYWISLSGQSFESVNFIDLPDRIPYMNSKVVKELQRELGRPAVESSNYIFGMHKALYKEDANGTMGATNSKYIVDPRYQMVDQLSTTDTHNMIPVERVQFPRQSEPFKAYADWLYSRHAAKLVDETERFDCTSMNPYGSSVQDVGTEVILKWKEFKSIQLPPVISETIRQEVRLMLRNFKLKLFKNARDFSSLLSAEDKKNLDKWRPTGDIGGVAGNTAITSGGKINFFGEKVKAIASTSPFAQIRIAKTSILGRPEDSFTGADINKNFAADAEVNPSSVMASDGARDTLINGKLTDSEEYRFHLGVDLFPDGEGYIKTTDGKRGAYPVFAPFDLLIEKESDCSFIDSACNLGPVLDAAQYISEAATTEEREASDRLNAEYETKITTARYTGGISNVSIYASSTSVDGAKHNGGRGNYIMAKIMNGPLAGRYLHLYHLCTHIPNFTLGTTRIFADREESIATDYPDLTKEEQDFLQEIVRPFSSWKYKKGTVIKAGDFIAFMGATGMSKPSSHLHAEISKSKEFFSLEDRFDLSPLIWQGNSVTPTTVIDAFYKSKGIKNKDGSDATYESVNKLPFETLPVGGSDSSNYIRDAVRYAMTNKGSQKYRGKNSAAALLADEKAIIANRKNPGSDNAWDYWKLTMLKLEQAGYRLYTKDLTNFDLFYRDHELIIPSAQNFAREQVDDYDASPMLCTYINGSLSNSYRTIPVLGVMAPTAQYVGANDDNFVIDFQSVGLNSIKKLEIIRDTLRKQGITYKHIPEAYSLRVENPFINAFGNVYFVINNLENATKKETPGVHARKLTLVSNNIYIKGKSVVRKKKTNDEQVKRKFVEEFFGPYTEFLEGDSLLRLPLGVQNSLPPEERVRIRNKITGYLEKRLEKGFPAILPITKDGVQTGKLGLFIEQDAPGAAFSEDYAFERSKYLQEIVATLNLVNSLQPAHDYTVVSNDIPKAPPHKQYVYSSKDGYVQEIPNKEIFKMFGYYLEPSKSQWAPYSAGEIIRYNGAKPNHVERVNRKLPGGGVEWANKQAWQLAVTPDRYASNDVDEYSSGLISDIVNATESVIGGAGTTGLDKYSLFGAGAPPQWDWSLEKEDYDYDFTGDPQRVFAFDNIDIEAKGSTYESALSVFLKRKELLGSKPVNGTLTVPPWPGYLLTHRRFNAVAQNTQAIFTFYNIVGFRGIGQGALAGVDLMDFILIIGGITIILTSAAATAGTGGAAAPAAAPAAAQGGTLLALGLNGAVRLAGMALRAAFRTRTAGGLYALSGLIGLDADTADLNLTDYVYKGVRGGNSRDSYIDSSNIAASIGLNQIRYEQGVDINTENEDRQDSMNRALSAIDEADVYGVLLKNQLGQNAIDPDINLSKGLLGDFLSEIDIEALREKYIDNAWYEYWYGTRWDGTNTHPWASTLGIDDGSLVDTGFINYMWNYLCAPYLNNMLRISEIRKLALYTDWLPGTRKLLIEDEQSQLGPAYEDLDLPFHPYWNERKNNGDLNNVERLSTFTEPGFYLVNPATDIVDSEKTNPLVEDAEGNGVAASRTPEQAKDLMVDIAVEKAIGEQAGLSTVSTLPRRIYSDTANSLFNDISTKGANNTNIGRMTNGASPEEREEELKRFEKDSRPILNDNFGRVCATVPNTSVAKDGTQKPAVGGDSGREAQQDIVVSWREMELEFGQNTDLLGPLSNSQVLAGRIFNNPLLNYTPQQYDNLSSEFYLSKVRERAVLNSVNDVDNRKAEIEAEIKYLRAKQVAQETVQVSLPNPDPTKTAEGAALPKQDENRQLDILTCPAYTEPVDVYTYTDLDGDNSYPVGMQGDYFNSSQKRSSIKTKVQEALMSVGRKKLSIQRAFPVAVAFFYDEDDIDKKDYIAFDEVYRYSAIDSIEISDSRKRPASICRVVFNDSNGILSGFNQWNKASDLAGLAGTGLDGGGESDSQYLVDTAYEQSDASFILSPGLKMKICMGYTNDVNKLEEVFLGEITGVELDGSSMKVIVEAQSYGAELVADIKGSKRTSGKDNKPITYEDTFATLAGLMFSPEVVHFGRRKFDDIPMFLENQSLEKHAVFFKENTNIGGVWNAGRRGATGWTVLAGIANVSGVDELGFSMSEFFSKAERQKSMIPTEGPQDDNIFAPNVLGDQVITSIDNLKRFTKAIGGEFTWTTDTDFVKVTPLDQTEVGKPQPGNDNSEEKIKAIQEKYKKKRDDANAGAAFAGIAGGTGRSADIQIEIDRINAEEDAEIRQVLGENKFTNTDGYWLAAWTIEDLQYTPYYSTIWDVFQEMTYRHPGYVKHPRIYYRSNRMTIFFGFPDQNMWESQGDPSELFLANRLFLDLALTTKVIDGSGKLASNSPGWAGLEGMASNHGMTLQAIRASKGLSSEANSASETVYEALTESPTGLAFQINSEKLSSFLQFARRRFRPFRRWHYVNSYCDIAANNIEATADGWFTEVNVQFGGNQTAKKAYNRSEADGRDPNAFVKWNDENIVTRVASIDLSPNFVRSTEYQFVNVKSKRVAKRYARSILVEQAKEMYKGTLTIIGNPYMRPYDIVMINDTTSNMYGPIEIEEVHQIYGKETGWVTVLHPDTLVIHDDVNPYAMYWGVYNDVFTATELYAQNATLMSPITSNEAEYVSAAIAARQLQTLFDGYASQTEKNLKELADVQKIWNGDTDPRDSSMGLKGLSKIAGVAAGVGTTFVSFLGAGALSGIPKIGGFLGHGGVNFALALVAGTYVGLNTYFAAGAAFQSFIMNYVADSRAYFIIPLVKEGVPFVAGINLPTSANVYKSPTEYIRQWWMDGGTGLSNKEVDLILEHRQLRERHGKNLSTLLDWEMEWNEFWIDWDKGFLDFGDTLLKFTNAAAIMNGNRTLKIGNSNISYGDLYIPGSPALPEQ
jgi:hypothetical protein